MGHICAPSLLPQGITFLIIEWVMDTVLTAARTQAPTEWFKAQTSCRGVSNAVIYLQGRDHMLCPILSELTAVYL